MRNIEYLRKDLKCLLNFVKIRSTKITASGFFNVDQNLIVKVRQDISKEKSITQYNFFRLQPPSSHIWSFWPSFIK